MKFVSNIVAVLATALASAATLAAEPTNVTYKVNGIGAGTTTMAINGVSGNKLDLTISGIAAVWKKDPGSAYDGAKGLPSEDQKGKIDYVLSYATNPAAFVGARQCILKRGADWPGTTDLASLKLDDATKVVCSPITATSGAYVVDVTGDYNVLGIVPVIEFRDGSRAWGSHPFGQSRGKNKRGQTITLVELTRDATGNATTGISATDGAKAYFRGNFE